ncbi:MAG: hypothetical protein AB9M53_06675 [Leptothrix sp. (in: b-proteobacteria)]
MTINMLSRRLDALKASQPSTEPLRLLLQFVNPVAGLVSAWYFADGPRLERRDGETEADFLARVEAAR